MTKKITSIVILLYSFLCNNIYAQKEVSKIEFYTEHVSIQPIIKINNKFLLQDIDSLVLSYHLHNKDKYKHYVYSINVHEDSLKRGSTIYIGLVPESALGSKLVKGVFNRGDALFLYYLDNPDNLYSYTGEYEELEYKRLDRKIGNHVEEDVNLSYDFPSWIFLYEKNRLKLHSTQFVTK